jgi:hypothetical protein
MLMTEKYQSTSGAVRLYVFGLTRKQNIYFIRILHRAPEGQSPDEIEKPSIEKLCS